MRVKLYLIWQFILLSIILAVLLTGCKSQSVPVTHTRDSVRIETRVRVDSVYRDRWHTEYIKGDTLHVRDSVFIDRWHFSTKTDSVCVRDSIPYEVQVPTRCRNGYDRFTSCGFWILIALILLRIAWWLICKFYLKR